MSKRQNTPGIKRRRFRPYPEYKDSGAEWPGKIPAHWEARRLKYLSRIIMGQSPPSDIVNTSGEGLPFLQGNADFGTEHPIARTFCPYPPKVAAPEDILISVRAPVGAINSADREYGIGRGLCAIRPFIRQLERRFCSYLLQIARSQLDSIATGSTYDAVSANDVSCLMLYLPSIEEQHRISYFLDCETAKLDASIEKKERLIELLQEKRTAIITQAVTKGLDPTVPLKDSGVEWLGKIPAHWAIESNKRLFEDSDIRSDYGDEELLTVSHLSGVTRHSEKNVTMIEAESYEDYKICRTGELAINTMWAWMGALGIAKENGIISPSYNVYALRKSSLDSRYYDYLCRTPIHIAELTRYSKGIWKSRLRLYPDGFYEISTPLPPKNEQKYIADFLDSSVPKVDTLLMTIRTALGRLREYRIALISAAVTGKVDVTRGALRF